LRTTELENIKMKWNDISSYSTITGWKISCCECRYWW